MRLASRIAFSMYAHRRSGSSGHAATSVWRIVYSSIASGAPSARSGALQLPPVAHRRDPLVRHARRARRAGRARRPSASCRASGRRAGGAGSARRAARCRRGTRATRERPAARVAADVVEREQPHVAVERGVLDALRHDRRRRLLEARDERAPARPRASLQPGLAQHRAVRRGRRPADVGAVDGQRRERRLEPLDAGPARAAAGRRRARTSCAPARAWPRPPTRRTAARRRRAPPTARSAAPRPRGRRTGRRRR